MKHQLTDAQKAKAKKRREQFAALFNQVKGMEKDEIAALADELSIRTIEDHELSQLNQVLLSYQRENVTVVGGFRQWLAHGRAVRKGERGLAIWIPASKSKDEKATPEEPDIFFLMGTVFDVSQTQLIQGAK